jgi:5-formyltetrahydrofolate cyclo-ligase
MSGGHRGRRRHADDACGPAELLQAKAELRDEVWSALTAARVSRFPGAEGRIPNFVGAEEASRRLQSTEEWRAARTIKANPDAAQWPVRQRALEDAKLVFMAVPRLAAPEPFFLLDPGHLADSPRTASSLRGASRSARRISLDALKPVDLVVAGCVAAGEDGARLGKGGGFSDLEFAVASEAGLIGPDTVVVTTVHELQLRGAGVVPTTDHDVPLDLVVTPTRVIDCRAGRPARGLARVRWDELTEAKIAAIPLLAEQRSRGAR